MEIITKRGLREKRVRNVERIVRLLINEQSQFSSNNLPISRVVTWDGGVVDPDIMSSHRETKLIAIDKQTNDNVMHLGRLGEADRFAREPLDSRAQCQMFLFNLLRITFSRDMNFGGQMPRAYAPQ